MTKSQHNEQVGDLKSPPLQPRENALRAAADQAVHIQANISPPAGKFSAVAGLACALKARKSSEAPLTMQTDTHRVNGEPA
jgi:hypothetical protein